MDNISKEERSRVMASVRQRDTKPEKKVRSFLHKRGLRYRLHVAIASRILWKFSDVASRCRLSG